MSAFSSAPAISAGDRRIIRDLAARVAEIADLPIHKEKAAAWTRHNGLVRGKPLVLVNAAQSMWWELLPDGELRTTTDFCRAQELALRKILYSWENMRDDHPIDARIECPIAITNTRWGIRRQTIDPEHKFGARHYETIIKDESDLEMIKEPVVTVDREETERRFQTMSELYDGLLAVKKVGTKKFWFAIMDDFIQWRGIERMFMDLVENPDFVHAAMERMTRGYLSLLDQLESQGLLSLNNGNDPVASGGLGFTDELPADGFDGQHVRSVDLWGHATTQIFTQTISPAQHEEFAIQYESRFLERFGLACYGCCEPLDAKLDIVKKIPNLRRVSMSPWVDPARGAEGLGSDYIFSYKPNPAIVSMDDWDVDLARRQLRGMLEATRGCVVEVILKDLHTCRDDPRRMWEWTRMAMELTEEYA